MAGTAGCLVAYMLSGTTLTVDGLILTLVLVIVFFALALYLLEATDPGQIAGLRTRVDVLYFTMATATTVGYGDKAAMTPELQLNDEGAAHPTASRP